MDDELVGVLGHRLGMDRGQLLASWGIQRGTVVLPKGTAVLPKDAVALAYVDQALTLLL